MKLSPESTSAKTSLSNWKLNALSSATIWSLTAFTTVGASFAPLMVKLSVCAAGVFVPSVSFTEKLSVTLEDAPKAWTADALLLSV